VRWQATTTTTLYSQAWATKTATLIKHVSFREHILIHHLYIHHHLRDVGRELFSVLDPQHAAAFKGLALALGNRLEGIPGMTTERRTRERETQG
jgi:hypothetical protein